MKAYITILIGLMLALQACEPASSTEGITLPTIDFPINIEKDTTYIKLGDTLRLTCTISSILSDGTKLKDGKADISIGSGYSAEMPIMNQMTVRTAKENVDFILIEEEGLVDIKENSSNLLKLSAFISDSIKIKFLYIPLNKGTHSFHVASLFFEGSQGKTRTNPYFNIIDNNGGLLWQVPNMPAISPNEPEYNKHYYFAVTD